jgi:hypothetical protein
VAKPFGPFYRQGFCCPASKITFVNGEAILEDVVEDPSTVVSGQAVLFPEDVYADPLLVGPSM